MTRSSRLKIAMLALLMVASGTAAVSATYTWFQGRADFSLEDLVGSSVGAYFAGGKGTSGEPYILKNRNHVYNLAWLQYMNYFTDDQGNPKQIYFRVDADIDMGGLVIPPIGSKDNPFIGIFDGNEHVISDLKVSNFIGQDGITTRPSSGINSKVNVLYERDDGNDQTVEDPINIVGFFGVVGELERQDGQYSYGSSIPSVTDLALEDITIQSASGSALVGLGVGYVNGTISGMAIGNSAFDIASSTLALGKSNGFTDNLSDFSLAGYCTSTCLGKTDIVKFTSEVPNVTDAGAAAGGNAYGASIPMQSIYQRIVNAKKRSSTSSYDYYITRTTETITPLEGPVTTTDTYSDKRTATDSDTLWVNDTVDFNGEDLEYAAYYQVNRTDRDDYTYLYGETSVSFNQTHVTAVSEERTGMTIKFGDYYLRDNNGSVAATTTFDNDCVWYWYNGGTNDTYLFAQSEGTTHYLRCNRGTLSLSTTRYTTWNYDSGYQRFKTTTGTTYYLIYDNGWKTSTTVERIVTQSQIRTTDATPYYVGVGSASSEGYSTIATIDPDQAATFDRPSGSTGKFSITISGTVYNLYARGDLRTRTDYNLVPTTSGNKTYLTDNDGWYLKRDGSSWTHATSTNDATPVQIVDTAFVYPSQLTVTSTVGRIRTSYNSTTESASYKTHHTFIPLTFNEDGTDVGANNTGYIVGGTQYYKEDEYQGDIRVSRYNAVNSSYASTSTLRRAYGLTSGNGVKYNSTNAKNLEVLTRTAGYSNGSKYVCVKDAYNTNRDSVPSSLSNSGATEKLTPTQLGLKRYVPARRQLDAALKGVDSDGNPITVENNMGNDLYGLHFMNAAISKSNTITVEKAKISGVTYANGAVYEDKDQLDEQGRPVRDKNGKIVQVPTLNPNLHGKCELPQSCIDFSLSRNGRITFFAGSYFPDNNTFFSLHRIFRDENDDYEDGEAGNTSEIKAIKEIKSIYNNTLYDEDDPVKRDYPQTILVYNDNTCSGATDPHVTEASTSAIEDALGSKVFDTTWITTGASTNFVVTALYYFEIPVIAGEYALGSVSNRQGAYLMYLDIGASDVSDEAFIVEEKITKRTEQYAYPAGMDFTVLLNAQDKPVFAAIEGGESAAVVIPASSGGDFTFTPSDGLLTCGPPQGVTLSSTFIGDGITLKFGSTTATATPYFWEEQNIEKEVDYEYWIDNTELRITTTTTTTYTRSDGTKPQDDGASTVTITKKTMSTADFAEIKGAVLVPTSGEVMARYSFYCPHGATYTVDTEMIYSNTSKKYTYKITISSSVDLTVHVTYVHATHIVVVNNTTISSIPQSGSYDIEVTASA